jgi:WD40 repeat protein
MAFSPDGVRWVTASSSLKEGTGKVRLWDARSDANLVELMGHTGTVSAVAYSPGGARLATASADGTVRLWDAHLSPSALVLKGPHASVAAVTFGADGTRLRAQDQKGQLYAWERTTGNPLDETEALPANATTDTRTH